MNAIKHKFSLLLILSLTAISLAAPVILAAPSTSTFAAAPSCSGVQVASEFNNAPDLKACCPKGTSTSNAEGKAQTSCIVTKYLTPFVQLMSVLVALAVTASIIIGAIQYSGSGGDPAKVSAAKARMRNALIALLAYIFMVAALQFLIPGGL